MLLKLSAPMRSAPENVVTAPLDKGRKKGGVGSERQGESSGGGEKGWVCVGGWGVGGGVSSLQSDLFAKSGHNESIMSPLIRESVWGPANWA